MANLMVDGENDVPAYKELGIVHTSPTSGTKTYYPVVSASMKPVVGMEFESIEAAYSFYQKYALSSGFSVRKASQYVSKGFLRIKYFVCTKEGHKIMKPVDTLDNNTKHKFERRKPSQRTGCSAHIKLQLEGNGRYKIYGLIEGHNHSFVHQDDVHFLRAARELTFNKKQIIHGLSNINIGPVRAFNILRTMFGGFDKVGATKADCKNFKREINLYIGDYDAEMVVQRMLRKKEFCPNFSFDYIADKDSILRGMFWADEESKRSFYTFGDVISFDATYRHNRYNMVFVPFTGIDNHNRNVTIGAALLGSETADSYRWLLNCFKDAYGYAHPVVVTDQDPSMKRAIEDIFPDSRHRLCMWHIMDKLTGKVGSKICNSTDFKRRLCDIVWTDSIMTDQFENEWNAIMNDYNLTDHDWLHAIYEIRNRWIPAYYRDENMSVLMRTSSRSESENHLFGKFCNPRCTLVEFFAHFDSVIEIQRYEHRRNDHETRYKHCDIWSDFPLESQAQKIYTRTIFLDVQLEIEFGIHKCSSMNFHQVGDFTKFNVKDFLQSPSTFEVMIRQEDVTVTCSCKRFEQYGLLCCHIFCVLRLLEISEFPKQYIVRRWTREAVANSPLNGLYNLEDNQDIYGVVRSINNAHDHAINKLAFDMEKLCLYRDIINDYKAKVDEIVIDAPPPSKNDRFAELTGITQPKQIHVRAPLGTRNKGCGVHKRMKSAREIAISQAGVKPRECQKCKQNGHDIRNCRQFNPHLFEQNDTSSSRGHSFRN